MPIRRTALAASLLALTPLVVAGCGKSTDRAVADHPAGSSGAMVLDVTDGDTIDVRTGGRLETVRLIGVNAPERGECLAHRASRWLRDRVQGRDVELASDTSDRDRYGRLLRYVEVEGVDVGVGLVRAGLAIAREYPPDTARSAEYQLVERAAEDARTGMWASDACGRPAAGADVVIVETRFDAPGDDNHDLDQEWVRITNRSRSQVDLTGWVLKDESASHRYSFPRGFVLGSGASVTVRTGCGADSSTALHWCNEGSAVWNNSGDTAFLLDPAGNIADSRTG
jgi:micrococcal nuclease